MTDDQAEQVPKPYSFRVQAGIWLVSGLLSLFSCSGVIPLICRAGK